MTPKRQAENKMTVLLSAMHLEDKSILDTLCVTGDAVVINQSDHEDDAVFTENDRRVRMITVPERGLSRSRNRAIKAAEDMGNDICIFCDNDVRYVPEYQRMITDAFNRHPESDIIVFFIKRPERQVPVYDSEKKLGRLHAMKIFSPEVAFRVSALKRTGIRMDEDFGAGAKYAMGEENIFLWDCMRAGLNITYVPQKIAELIPNESTWFKGYTREFFRNRGAGYYRMSRILWFPLCVQFAVRKKKLFGSGVSVIKAVRWMCGGKREYEKEQDLSHRR
ncbi:Glycosyl transferase family 2 [Lachnospiraceae bacterium]|nr:Glycosyl transferase family 2 [Lachnospiraceae bacterium]